MTIEELREKMRENFPYNDDGDYLYDPEEAHKRADRLLLEYIGDQEVSDIFHEATLWYD
jgi:hypothetical protein